jgi:hypothetical protein
MYVYCNSRRYQKQTTSKSEKRSLCDLPRTSPTQKKKLDLKKREATSRMQFSKARGGMRGKNDERTNAAAAAAAL